MQRRKLLALAAIAAVVAVPSAQAHQPGAPGWKVVASGLDNPRGISLAPNGDLWIAEAGKGGPASSQLGADGTPVNCMPGEEGPTLSCFGNSGAFTRVHHGWQKRVVTGLPSFGDDGTGDNATGASDIVASGSHVAGLIGGGGGTAERAMLPPNGQLSDMLLKIDPWTGDVWPFADFAAYETANNPDHGVGPDGKPLIDSDSYGLAQVHGGYLVADAAGNDLLGVSYHRKISTLAVFGTTSVPAPAGIPGLPPMLDMEAVPTSVAVRPHDPNIYVGQLTGFPFPVGAASVWAVAPDGTKTMYASGFTNIVDIAWGKKGSLYVLEIAHNSLLSGDPSGALWRVWPNGHKDMVASTGLMAPTAVAVAKNGDVYVSNYGTSAGKGEVVDLGKI
ncbi:MAG TPA: ScyD/ScyE family protein [Gaiellales bacterium]|jgi:hypothetical protein